MENNRPSQRIVDLAKAQTVVDDINVFWESLFGPNYVSYWNPFLAMSWISVELPVERIDDFKQRFKIDLYDEEDVLSSVSESNPAAVHNGLGRRLSRCLRPFTNLPGDGRRLRITKRTRRHVLDRDGVCQMCGSHETLEFDHIFPKKFGGPRDSENVWLLCKKCNYLKHTFLYPDGLRLMLSRVQDGSTGLVSYG